MTEPEAPIRVVVDGLILKPGLGGIGTYTVELCRALSERTDVEITVVTSMPDRFPEAAKVIPAPAGVRGFFSRTVWRERHLRSILSRSGADILVTTVPELPLHPVDVPTVMTVHDVSQVVAPSFYGFPKFVRYALGLQHATRAATRIVCVSEATLVGLYNFFGVDLAKCEVIGQGPQGMTLTGRATSEPAGTPYVLYVGTLQRQKNLRTLLRAASAFSDGLELRIAGPCTDQERARLHAQIGALGLADCVRHEGYVSADRLRDLYANATALVLPSLIEGFGVPLLEAMAMGVPVVASDIPALREVGGDAVAFVAHPLDPGAWAIAINLLASRPDERAALIARGCERARRFSWPEVADRFALLLHASVSSAAMHTGTRLQ